MAMKRVCSALGFAYVATAAISDERCLVQSNKGMMTREAALAPNMPSLLANFKLDVPALVRQVTHQIPGMDAAMPDSMGGMGNMSIEDMMTYGMEMLDVFKNKTIVDALYQNLNKLHKGLLKSSEAIANDTKTLEAAVEAATSKDEVLVGLGKFLTSRSKEMAVSASEVIVNTRTFFKLLPSNLTFVQAAQPMLDFIGNATKADIKKMIWELMEPQVTAATANASDYCGLFEHVEANITALSDMMKDQVPGMVESGRAFVPQIEAMLKGFAPEAAPAVVKFVNASMDAAAEIVAALHVSIPKAADLLVEVSHEKVECVSALQQQSAAAPIRFSLFALVAAAAALIIA